MHQDVNLFSTLSTIFSMIGKLNTLERSSLIPLEQRYSEGRMSLPLISNKRRISQLILTEEEVHLEHYLLMIFFIRFCLIHDGMTNLEIRIGNRRLFHQYLCEFTHPSIFKISLLFQQTRIKS